MTIREFYGSQIWKKIRKQRLLLDNYKCSRCGGIAKDVHHKIRLTKENVNDLNISSLDNLESICRNCHNKETHKKQQNYKFDVDGNLVENKKVGKTD